MRPSRKLACGCLGLYCRSQQATPVHCTMSSSACRPGVAARSASSGNADGGRSVLRSLPSGQRAIMAILLLPPPQTTLPCGRRNRRSGLLQFKGGGVVGDGHARCAAEPAPWRTTHSRVLRLGFPSKSTMACLYVAGNWPTSSCCWRDAFLPTSAACHLHSGHTKRRRHGDSGGIALPPWGSRHSSNTPAMRARESWASACTRRYAVRRRSASHPLRRADPS